MEIGVQYLKSEGIQSSETKIKRVKDYSYRERLEKLGLTILLERRIRGDLIETFKIIKEISSYGRHFFLNIFFLNWKFTVKAGFKKFNQLDFFIKRVIYFWNKLPQK